MSGSASILVSWRPRIALLPGFLSGPECASLIAMGKRGGMSRAQVMDNQAWIRNSDSCWMVAKGNDSVCKTAEEHNLLRSIHDRVAHACMLPPANGETMQLLRYGPGQRYLEHPDYLTGTPRTNPEFAKGGQRVATVLMYLADVAPGLGGETYFPRGSPVGGESPAGVPLAASKYVRFVRGGRGRKASSTRSNHHQHSGSGGADSSIRERLDKLGAEEPGLYIRPAQGLACVFWNTLPNGRADPNSLHASLPVANGAGGCHKWTLTRWVRESKFDPYPTVRRAR